MAKNHNQPPGPEVYESEGTIEVASLIGEERDPLPEYVTDQVSEELSEADRLPAEQLGGMLAHHLPTEELRATAEVHTGR